MVANDEKKTELFKAFNSNSIYGIAVEKAFEERQKLAKIKLYYDTDDIFRREIDHLKDNLKKAKKPDTNFFESKIEELLREAEYRRYIASFET